MIVRTEGLGTVLTSHKKSEILTSLLPQTFHKQLKITLTKRHALFGFTCGRISIITNRHMLIIIGQSHKIRGLMILQLQHTTISPLARILKAAAYTLTTGDLYTLIHSTIRKSTTIWNIDIYPTIVYKLQMVHA